MERLRLDQEGARTGELFEHSLQLGDDTVTLGNIATMAIGQERFRPWDTPRNRQRLGLWLVCAAACFLIGILALAAMGFSGGSFPSMPGIVLIVASLLFCVAAWFAVRVSLKLRVEQDFFRLRIGTSDGRQIDLVDDSRRMLEDIRDAIRRKIDHEDWRTTGHFDLNRDMVELYTPDTDA